MSGINAHKGAKLIGGGVPYCEESGSTSFGLKNAKIKPWEVPRNDYYAVTPKMS